MTHNGHDHALTLPKKQRGWIGVDLDGTLAHYDGWKGAAHIGEPIPKMLGRVHLWLAMKHTVRIFTARVSGIVSADPARRREAIKAREHIQGWLQRVGLPKLDVTCVKDFEMIALWDDRATPVEFNTGEPKTLEYVAPKCPDAREVCPSCGNLFYQCLTCGQNKHYDAMITRHTGSLTGQCKACVVGDSGDGIEEPDEPPANYTPQPAPAPAAA